MVVLHDEAMENRLIGWPRYENKGKEKKHLLWK